MNGSDDRVYVFDHTALTALGRGSRQLSSFVSDSSPIEGRVVVPAMCLVAAVRDRPDIADHVARLPRLECVKLGLLEAAAVGELVAKGVDWRIAHAVAIGGRTRDRPAGRPVVTAWVDPYDRLLVPTLAFR
jgi:hypothetical protein